MTETISPVACVEDLTPAWLSLALGTDVTDVHISEVGTGQMGSCYRLRLTGSDVLPATLLAKLPTTDAGMREMLAGMYATEVRFYRELADTVAVRVPEVWYAELGEAGVFTILMQDLAPAEVGDQIAGTTVERARLAVENVAGLHARWADPSLLEVEGLSIPGAADAEMLELTLPDATEAVIDVLGDLVSDEDADTLRAAAKVVGPWIRSRSERYAMVHGDYRLDNLLFHPDAEQVWAVDWQGVSLGLPARDVSYCLATGLSIEERRTHERELVGAYHARLLEHGVTGHSFEECFDDYRYGMLQMPMIVIFGCAYGARSERGDRMFAVMIERGCAAIRDLDLLSMV